MGMQLLKLKYHINAFAKILLYKLLFGNLFLVGRGTTFRRFFNIYLEKGATISIGRDCFFNHSCSINALEKITIGDGCIFGENVKIYDHNHRFTGLNGNIKSQGYTTGKVYIGNRCWFGSNVVVLKGVHIGDNCVIGAGCIVSNDIPPNSIVTCNRELNIESIQR